MKKGLVLIFVFILFTIGGYFLRTKNRNLFKSSTPTETLVQQIFLSVSQPIDKSTVSSSTLVVKGKTLAEADVFVSDKEIKADSTGNFSASIVLDEGENSIIIIANDSQGNYSEKELTVTLETSL